MGTITLYFIQSIPESSAFLKKPEWRGQQLQVFQLQTRCPCRHSLCFPLGRQHSQSADLQPRWLSCTERLVPGRGSVVSSAHSWSRPQQSWKWGAHRGRCSRSSSLVATAWNLDPLSTQRRGEERDGEGPRLHNIIQALGPVLTET